MSSTLTHIVNTVAQQTGEAYSAEEAKGMVMVFDALAADLMDD